MARTKTPTGAADQLALDLSGAPAPWRAAPEAPPGDDAPKANKAPAKASPAGSLRLDLFDPEMTPLHRAGLAGLAASLERLGHSPLGQWSIDPDGVTLSWGQGQLRPLLAWISGEAFGLDALARDGIIDFLAWRSPVGEPPSYEARQAHQRGLMGSFWKQSKSRDLDTSARLLVLDPDANTPPIPYRPLTRFNHMEQHEAIADALEGGAPLSFVGWAWPGAVEKTPGVGLTRLQASPGAFLALSFAPIGTLSLPLWGGRYGTALVIPEIGSLEGVGRLLTRWGRLRAEALNLASEGEAALMLALGDLPTLRRLRAEYDSPLCHVMVLRAQPWNKQEVVRVLARSYRAPGDRALRNYRLASTIAEFQPTRLPNKEKTGVWYATSPARGAIARALADGRPWWQGLAREYIDADSDGKKRFEQRSERRGLHKMVTEAQWDEERQKLFVEVCHEAMRNMYGAIGDRTQKSNTNFGQKAEAELGRLRAALLRVKNAHTCRATLVEFWARAGGNKVSPLKALRRGDGGLVGWQELLPLLREEHWREARDLALLAMLSYQRQERQQDTEDDDAPQGEQA